MANGVIRYWAAAKAAAGVAQERYQAGTLAEALENACTARGEEFRLILARSSFLINGDPVGTRPHDRVDLPDDAVVEVLPPFAGG